jgi:hypothetical protein
MNGDSLLDVVNDCYRGAAVASLMVMLRALKAEKGESAAED